MHSSFSENREVVVQQELETLTRQLAELQAESKALQEAKSKADLSKKRFPWAFSPSGRWAPGLWSGLWDRDHPISNAIGAHPESISFARVGSALNKSLKEKRPNTSPDKMQCETLVA